jgi:hypothetical protein
VDKNSLTTFIALINNRLRSVSGQHRTNKFQKFKKKIFIAFVFAIEVGRA